MTRCIVIGVIIAFLIVTNVVVRLEKVIGFENTGSLLGTAVHRAVMGRQALGVIEIAVGVPRREMYVVFWVHRNAPILHEFAHPIPYILSHFVRFFGLGLRRR